MLENVVGFINSKVLGPLVPAILIIFGTYFTLRLKGFFILHPIRTVKRMTKGGKTDGVSPLSALSLALAGTLGVGNIAGVASAIMLGGYGAVFWMWISALFAMSLKYVEIVLAMKHRTKDTQSDGYRGGAMYYIRDCFEARKLKKAGVAVAAVFAVLCLTDALSMGSAVQMRAVSGAVEHTFGVSPYIVGIISSLSAAFIILGGFKRLTRVTDLLVPVMTLGYVILSIAVLILRYDMIIPALLKIVKDSMSFKSAGGGIVGFLTSRALRYGSMRGLLSNEAGCGTSPFAHSASSTEDMEKQGIMGIAEVFVDTLVLCTATALVIILGMGDRGLTFKGDPMVLTLLSYSSVLGTFSEPILTVGVIFFGFATVICWSHYGLECVRYFTRSKAAEYIFVIVYCIASFLGCIFQSSLAWGIADISIGAMTVINVIVLFLMRKEISPKIL